MKPLSRSNADARARREEYYRLRLSGMGKREAATAVGVADMATQALYERWFQAEHPGEAPAEPPGTRYYPYFTGSAGGPDA